MALTSEKATTSASILSFVIMSTMTFNHLFPDNDINGTEKREEALQQLTEEKDSLIKTVNDFQELRMKFNNADETSGSTGLKEALHNKQSVLTKQSKEFFTKALTNGSIHEGLDVSEEDIKNIMTDLRNNVDDFNWGTHIDTRIPAIIYNSVEHSNRLDEARSYQNHRYDVAADINTRLDTSFKIAERAKSVQKNSVPLMLMLIMGMAIINLALGLALDAVGKPIRRIEKPKPPVKNPSH